MAFERSVYTRRPYVRSGRVADLIQQGGRDEAAAHLRSGEITAKLFGNLGNIASGAVNQYQQEKLDAPVRARQARLDNANIGRVEGLAADESTTRTDTAAVQGAQGAFPDSLEEQEAHLRSNGHEGLIPVVRQAWTDQEKDNLDIQASTEALRISTANYWGSMAFTLKATGVTPQALDAMERKAERDGRDPERTAQRRQAVEQAIGQGPEAVDALLEQTINGSEVQYARAVKQREMELREETEARQTREGEARMAAQVAANARAQVAQTETRRHNLAMEATDPIADQTAAMRLKMLTEQYKQLTAKDEVEDLGAVGLVLDEVSEMADQIFTENGVWANFTGVWDKIGSATNYNSVVAEYEAALEGFAPFLAQAVGHKGVLTDVDLERTTELFGSIGWLRTDSKTIAKNKMDRVKRIMTGTASQNDKDLVRDEWFPGDGQNDDVDALWEQYNGRGY